MNTSQTIARFIVLGLIFSIISSCYFFRKRQPGVESQTSGVVGESLGPKAGGVDELALAEVHAVTTTHPAAFIRPDPDLMVRNLLLEYRETGSVVAREIGRVEQFRMLLGGASQDFTIVPQETYDATSLLAKLKVAEEICEGLVAPNDDQHPGWDSILPSTPDDIDTNLLFLAQRFQGKPNSEVDSEDLSSLGAILDTATVEGSYENESYVPVCATLVIDASFLLL